MRRIKLSVCIILAHLLLIHFVHAQPVPYDSKFVDSISVRLPNLPNDTGKVNNLAKLAAMHLFTDPAATVRYAREGVAIAKKINYPIGEIACLGQTAFYYAVTGDWAKATMDVNEALPLCVKYSPVQAIYLYNIMFINASTKGDSLEALAYAQKALHHQAFSKLPEIEKWPTYMQLGVIYENLNRLDSAIYYANVLVNFIEKYGSAAHDLANNSNTLIGMIAVKQEDYPKAIRYYQLASNNMCLAEVYQLLNQPDSVIYYGSIGLKTGEIQKNFNGIQAAAKLLAAAYKTSDPVKANAYLNMYAAAKDSLYNNAKLKQLEAIKLTEQTNKFELEKKETADKNKIVFISLFALLVLLIVFLLMLWKNNRIKQQANAELESAYKNVKATQAQLVQAEKMASLGELTAGIAHEIQNPLNFVNNFSDVNKELLEELKEEADKGNIDDVKSIANDVIENEEKINLHGRRADAIVKGMLQHSRKSTGQKEPTDINALANEYLRLSFHGLRAKDKTFNADFKTDFDETIGKINIVPQDMGRVFLNLYSNAFYAVHEHSKKLGGDYKPTVIVRTKRMNDKIEIRVQDNGMGISKSLVDKIFQPFFTTKPTGQGTGLGLSLSYDIVKAHGGELKVESNEGIGSAFSIYVPLQSQA